MQFISEGLNWKKGKNSGNSMKNILEFFGLQGFNAKEEKLFIPNVK